MGSYFVGVATKTLAKNTSGPIEQAALLFHCSPQHKKEYTHPLSKLISTSPL